MTGNLKNTTQIKLKKPSTKIRIIRKNKNKARERERKREREYSQFLCGKNIDWMEWMILNLYNIRWGEEESKYKKEEMMKEV